MFRPNDSCTITVASGKTDVYGKPLPSVTYTERCSVVKLEIKSLKSAIRSDTSATRGNARELTSDARILLTTSTRAEIDDVITVAGYNLRIMSKEPRYSSAGRLDHYEITAMIWS